MNCEQCNRGMEFVGVEETHYTFHSEREYTYECEICLIARIEVWGKWNCEDEYTPSKNNE